MSRAENRRTLERLESRRPHSATDAEGARTALRERLERSATAAAHAGVWAEYDPADIVSECERRLAETEAKLRETQREAAAAMAGEYPSRITGETQRRYWRDRIAADAAGATGRMKLLGRVLEAATADVAAGEVPVAATADGYAFAPLDRMSCADLVTLVFTRP